MYISFKYQARYIYLRKKNCNKLPDIFYFYGYVLFFLRTFFLLVKQTSLNVLLYLLFSHRHFLQCMFTFACRFRVHLSHPAEHGCERTHHVSVKRSEDPSIACAFNMMNIERLYDSSKGRVTGRWEAYLHVSVCLSVSLFNSSCVGCRTFFVPYSKDSCGWLIRVCIPQVYLRGETFYYTLSLKSMTNYFLFFLSFS